MPKILIFEDEKMLADMYATKLRLNGFDVAVYYDPTIDPVGVAVKEKPDLISSGIIMPVMTGFQALGKIKADQRTKHIPVVLLSNLGQKKDIEKGKSLGATDYLVKAHFTPSEVVKKFYHILGLPIPPEKPIPPPGDAWRGQSVADLPPDKPKSWWKKLFG